MTYLISIGNFAHIIAGSMEAFMLVVNRDAELWRIVQGFLVPVLIL
jgi:formate-nitrite transporter family protein